MPIKMSKCWNLCTLEGLGKWRSGAAGLIRDALLFARLVLFPPTISHFPFPALRISSCGSFIMEKGAQKEMGQEIVGGKGWENWENCPF